MPRVVTEEGLAYEQRKDSYRRATLLGALLVGAGALLVFYGQRIRKAQQEYAKALEGLKVFGVSLADTLQTIPGMGQNTTALRQWAAQPRSGRFDDVLSLPGKSQVRISLPILIIILGGVILAYALFMQERWRPPRNSFIDVAKVKKKGRKP